ncbi:MAG: hypothetical protein ABJG42_24200 [Vibrio splendidus]
MHLTIKQREIIKVIMEGNLDPDNQRFCDVDLNQILERINYKTTKHSLQFSIRSLIKKGVIVKGDRECRRGKSRQTFKMTEMGEKLLEVV